jgi:hypothetical protein
MWAGTVEVRFKVLVLMFVVINDVLYFVMVESDDPRARQKTGHAQYAPPGGSVNERSADVLALDSPRARAVVFAQNGLREFSEEVLKSDYTLPSLIGEDGRLVPNCMVVGGCKSLPSTVPATGGICWDKLESVVADVVNKDAGAYLEVEYRVAGDELPVRVYLPYSEATNVVKFANDAADHAFRATLGDDIRVDHVKTRVFLNVISFVVADITAFVEAQPVVPADAFAAAGVFHDGRPVTAERLARMNPIMQKLVNMLGPRAGEISAVHIMSADAIKAGVVAGPATIDSPASGRYPATRYHPWLPVAPTLGDGSPIWKTVGALVSSDGAPQDDAPPPTRPWRSAQVQAYQFAAKQHKTASKTTANQWRRCD